MKKTIAILTFIALTGCSPEDSGINGYVEGDYLRIAPTSAGVLKNLSVERGDTVTAGQPLFSLDLEKLLISRTAAEAALDEAEARLNNMKKGQRPEEIAVLREQKLQAEADLRGAADRLKRSAPLAQKGYATKAESDADRAAFAKASARVQEMSAQLKTAALGAREDEIAAAQAAVDAAKQSLLTAVKLVLESAPKAAAAGRIEDVFYRPGEFVPAGAPVVSLLPPENVKIRFFVPEKTLAQVRHGMTVGIACDSCPAGLEGKVSFISSQAEYTPPVIYSTGSRDKLVFMVEAKPLAHAAALHPGQPVDITLPKQ